MESLGNWHRRATGHYVRKRGSVYDSVRHLNRGARMAWFAYANGEDLGRPFKTRLEATAALDSHIRNSTADKPSESKPDTECDGCGGSGIWYGRGYMENGVFRGPTGKCFRCDGKGHQTEADRKRNQNYDNYIRKIEA